jgi:hypothetical protein
MIVLLLVATVPCGNKAESLFDGVDKHGFIHHVKLPTRNCLLETISKFSRISGKVNCQTPARALSLFSLSL